MSGMKKPGDSASMFIFNIHGHNETNSALTSEAMLSVLVPHNPDGQTP